MTPQAPAPTQAPALPAWQRALRWATLAGLGAAAALTAVVLQRYPGGERANAATVAFGTLAIGSLSLLTVGMWWSAGHARTSEARRALALGTTAGLAAGALWLAEISFNNVLPPDVSVPHRDLVDNLFWLATVLLTLAAATVAGWRGGSVRAGVLAGAWAGLLSGLIACLYGLALVVFRLDLILRDPLAQAEFAVRGPSSATPDMATYFARDTAAGALGHLVLLGVIVGLLLGALGGGIGALAAHGRRRGG
ncbi:MAG TPA: hypothetical protein VID73_05550 [Ktedonobacterales bacterium]